MQQEEPKLYDIYSVEYNPWFLQSWFIYLVIGCAVLCIGYLVYCWYKARRKPVISYEKQLLARLEMLQKNDWSDHKQFYIQLTSLLKEYLQYRFGKQFTGTTDTECLKLLRSDKFIPEWIVTRFEDLIDGLMFVKFANAQAAQERMQKDLESVRVIFHNTVNKD